MDQLAIGIIDLGRFDLAVDSISFCFVDYQSYTYG